MTELASTKGLYNADSLSESWSLESEAHDAKYNDPLQFPRLLPPMTVDGYHSHGKNIPRSLQWSQDGTSFVTYHEDFGIRLFLLDLDILSATRASLVPINRIFQNGPIISQAVNPKFSLYNDFDYDNSVLVSQRGVPIKLIALTPQDSDGDLLLNSYKFEDTQHDKLMETSSICFDADGGQFVAGSTNKVAVFDLSRTEPRATFDLSKTGIISCVANSSLSTSIYTGSYIKNEVCVLNPNSGDVVMRSGKLQGNGINQVIESDNERYLFPIPRNSNIIPILDLRMGLQQVGSLLQWHSTPLPSENKNQKIYADKLTNSRGIIAGSSKGEIKIWQDAELGMDCESKTLLKLDIEDNVSCVQMNPLNEVEMLGVTTGSRYVEDESGTGISLWNMDNNATL